MNSDKQPAPQDWEAALGRALKNLPERPAPDTLMPNVMARIRARAAQPWYRQSWWHWPAALRVASATVACAVLALLPLAGGHFWETSASPLLNRWLDVAQTVQRALVIAADAVFPASWSLGPETLRWLIVFAGLLLTAMYLTCIGIGTVVYRTVRK
jgi:hypothetical protein